MGASAVSMRRWAIFVVLAFLSPLLSAATTESIARPTYEIDLDVANSIFSSMRLSCPNTEPLVGREGGEPFNVPFELGVGLDSIPTNFLQRSTGGFPYRITCVEDLFSEEVRFGRGKKFRAPTHLFGNETRIIPYADSDDVEDAAGIRHRGDEVVAQYFPLGEVGFAIKHHRPFHRCIEASSLANVQASSDEIKLQDTHVEMVVGVRRNGRAGVVTLSNPQDYQNGGFGDDHFTGDYPMIFCKAVFPAYVPASVRAQFMDNLRLMAVGFNTVSRFPENYNGGDPLAACDPDKIREHVKMMVQAVAGNHAAQKFFKQAANLMYCAELAFVSTSAALIVPLNRQNVLKLGVTEREWNIFEREVALHNKHRENEPSFFVKNNKNDRIRLIDLPDLITLDSLEPLAEYSSAPAVEGQKLAFQPLTMADLIDGFMRLTLPRQEIGEELAPYQAQILARMKPALLQMLSTDANSPSNGAAALLFDDIVAAVGERYNSYDGFRAALDPLLQKAQKMTGAGTQNVFTPPSLFHLVLKGVNTENGLLNLEYVGNGLHFSMVKPQ
jgi:hypothetical protein